MRKRFIGFAATCLMILVGVGTTLGQISVPDKIDVNRPIIIGAQEEADVYIWRVDRPAIRVIVDNGKTVHVWAPVGKYEVTLTTITVNVGINPDWDPESGNPPTIDKDIEYDEHYAFFEVEGEDGPEPPDDPDDEPTEFKQIIADGVKKIDAVSLSYKGEVASIYRVIALEAESQPSSWDAATMVNEAKVRVATMLPTSVLSGWSVFWPELAKAFKSLKMPASDLAGHIKAFKEVAETLEK